MSTRYTDYNTFLHDAVETAKIRSDLLKRRYDIFNLMILPAIQTILAFGGLGLLVAVAAIAWAGPVAVVAAIASLGTNPIGIALLAAFGAGAAGTLWTVYRDRRLAEAVVEVGKRLRPSWEMLARNSAPTEDFDALHQEAVVALWVSPSEFYSKHRDADEVRRWFEDLRGN